ncbi:MAG: tetratricopeptide repeat protein [Myxococcales bacterium]|nr:tetratricopeptide repeat protein [Myxococcales bacterium]MCB9733041.1 tetratricopeptide repeat protein [Deltaproteobacteria bacterium]
MKRILGWAVVAVLASALAAPAVLAAAPKGKAPAAEQKKPGFGGQTKTRDRKIRGDATEVSLKQSIKDQKQIIELTDRKDPGYPLQVVALADFEWDLAEWYGLQAYSEAIEKPMYEAEQRGDKKAVEKYKKQQQSYLDKKQAYQDQTIATYKEVIHDFPTSKRLDEVRYFLAYNLTEMGRAAEGVDEYTALIGAHPSSPFVPDAIVNIGEYYFDNNDFANALRLYQQVDKFPDANIRGYAMYKQAWCQYNLGDHQLSLSQFIAVIKLAEERALAGAKQAIQLKREAQNDMVLPYSKVGRAEKAIDFLKQYAPERYLELAGKLALIYTEQNEFARSTKLLRDLIAEARKGAIAGQDKSYMVVTFQRQIVDNAIKSGDKGNTVTEIAELLRTWDEMHAAAPEAFQKEEQEEIKRLILEVAATYQKEWDGTKDPKTLEYTQRLYDEYLRVFGGDENAYQIAMNNALLLKATEKFDEAAAAFEKVIRMRPEGEYTDAAAEQAVLCYLKVVQIENKRVKTEAEDDLKPEDLSPDQQRFVSAIDRWMEIIAKKGPNPESQDNIGPARFAAAKVYYNANQFEESARRFVEFIAKHPSHRLVNDARRHVLSAYNLAHDVDNLVKYANEYDAIASLPEDLKSDIRKIRNELNFQECFKFQNKGEHLKAAQCFEQYARDFPNEDRAPAAIYNAGINYFEARKVKKALDAQLDLYARYRSNELAPKALYAMGEMFRQTTVYDEAVKVYETFVRNHRGHPLEEKALRYASIYRKTLGDYKEAIANLNTWLARFGNQPNAPAVHLDIIKILEKQEKWSQIVSAAGSHLKKYPDEPASVRLEVLARRGFAYDELGKHKEAHAAFEETVAYFAGLNEAQVQDLSMDAVSAVAHAHFNLGEEKLREARRIKLDSPSDKEMAKAITQKLTTLTNAKTVYEKVIAYHHPGWEIAAWTQLGAAYQDFASSVENATIPARIRHLPEVVDQWQQDMAERAKTIRDKAIEAYQQALDVAHRERWFNEYSEKAEAAIAQLDLTDKSVKEFRIRPDHLTPNGGAPAFHERAGASQ